MANFMFVLAFFFCDVLASPDQMPRFWIFLYHTSPLSYYVSAILSTGLANIDVECAFNKFTTLHPPDNQSCGEYLQDYIAQVGGYLVDDNYMSDCQYCKIKDTNIYLSAIGADYSTRWRKNAVPGPRAASACLPGAANDDGFKRLGAAFISLLDWTVSRLLRARCAEVIWVLYSRLIEGLINESTSGTPGVSKFTMFAKPFRGAALAHSW